MLIIKHRINTIFFILGTSAALAACSSVFPQRNGESSPLSLDRVDKIQINVSRSNDLEALFGAPTLKLPIPKSDMEAWLYCVVAPCTQGRLTVHLSLTSGLVRKVIWNTESGDHERKLEAAIEHFKDASFLKSKVLVDYGRYLYTWDAYEDREIGVLVSFDDHKKFVTSITRAEPKRELIALQADASKRPRVTIIPIPSTAKNP